MLLIIYIKFNKTEASLSTIDYKKDSYLTYVYSSEKLPYNLTYRLIDFYANLEILHNKYSYAVKDYSEINSSLQTFLSWSRQTKFLNTIIKGKENDSVALDTFCIVSWLYNDTSSVKHLIPYITPENNLMADNYYAQSDHWRNIADETWCVMLIKESNFNSTLADELLKIKLSEGTAFLKNDTYAESDKAAVIIHELLLLNEFPSSHSQDKIYWLSKASEYINKEEISPNTLLIANLLNVMINYNSSKESISPYITILEKRKRKDNYWLPYETASPDNGQIFTTSRVLITLRHYKQKYT